MRPNPSSDQRPLADRVQRIVDGDVPILHLEPEMPQGTWDIVIDGLVDAPVTVCIDEIHAREPMTRSLDLHCVWGWSRPDNRWEGVHIKGLVPWSSVSPGATHVLVSARDSPYASCFTTQEVLDGLFAWRLDGRDLKRERGWPLRFIPPAYKWAYKSVKWIERITFLDSFQPGFWEERVGDPKGNIPWDVLERFQGQAEAWRRTKGRR